MNIKKFLIGAATGALMLGAMVTPAFAAEPNWDLTGNWKIDFALDGGAYDSSLYDLTLNQVGNVLTGTGRYPSPGPSYAYGWDVTGSIDGNTFTLVDTYTLGAVGTVMNMEGTVAPDGTISGTWNDNYLGGYRSGTWKTITGKATAIEHPVLVGPPTDKNQCKKDGWRTFNNPSFRNQGQCVSYVESHRERENEDNHEEHNGNDDCKDHREGDKDHKGEEHED